MQPTSPSGPRIPANELRPTRHGYVAAAAVAVVLIALGVAIGAYRIDKVVDAVETEHRFSNGETVTVRLDPEHPKAIWLKDPGPWFGSKCEITGPGDPGLTDPSVDFYPTYDETWNPFDYIEVSQAGEYQVTCTSDEPGTYAIGDRAGFLGFAGGMILAVLLPVFGVAIGVVMALVTAIRRSGHRKRLLAERHGSGGDHPAPAVLSG